MGMLFGLAQRLKDLWRSSQKGNRLQDGDRYDSDDAFLHLANVSEKRGNLGRSGDDDVFCCVVPIGGFAALKRHRHSPRQPVTCRGLNTTN
jgi:hypothetical protein